MFNIDDKEAKKYLEIFLFTLPYKVLIKPFKDIESLQKRLSGFRLNEKSCPPQKIIPILCNEILKSNLKFDDFVNIWLQFHEDVFNKISILTVDDINKNIDDLINVFGLDLVISSLLIDKRDGINDIIKHTLELKERDTKKESEKDTVDYIEIENISKIKKLEKEVEKTKEKLLREQKKNIIEIENFKKAIENKDNEILNLNKKIEKLKSDKRQLESRITHIGVEFDRHLSKIVNESVSKEKNIENVKTLVTRYFIELKQENIELKSYLSEIKESISDLSNKVSTINTHENNEQAAVSLEDNDYSLLDDLSKMLKNS